MYKKLFIILNLIMFSAFVFADQPVLDRISSGIFSENKKFVYVFWTEGDEREEIHASSYYDSYKSLISRKNFPTDGLYLYNGKKFLWVIDKNERDFEARLDPLDDGIHLIKHGSPHPISATELAFSFYKNGKLIKSYTIKEICNDDSKFSHWNDRIIWKSEDKLDNKNKVYTFKSCNKNMKIDVTTGKLSIVGGGGFFDWFNKKFGSH
jgi:hypothetical protein